jgi:hypothetical protein
LAAELVATDIGQQASVLEQPEAGEEARGQIDIVDRRDNRL